MRLSTLYQPCYFLCLGILVHSVIYCIKIKPRTIHELNDQRTLGTFSESLENVHHKNWHTYVAGESRNSDIGSRKRVLTVGSTELIEIRKGDVNTYLSGTFPQSFQTQPHHNNPPQRHKRRHRIRPHNAKTAHHTRRRQKHPISSASKHSSPKRSFDAFQRRKRQQHKKRKQRKINKWREREGRSDPPPKTKVIAHEMFQDGAISNRHPEQYSRSFKHPITDLSELTKDVNNFAHTKDNSSELISSLMNSILSSLALPDFSWPNQNHSSSTSTLPSSPSSFVSSLSHQQFSSKMGEAPSSSKMSSFYSKKKSRLKFKKSKSGLNIASESNLEVDDHQIQSDAAIRQAKRVKRRKSKRKERRKKRHYSNIGKNRHTSEGNGRGGKDTTKITVGAEKALDNGVTLTAVSESTTTQPFQSKDRIGDRGSGDDINRFENGVRRLKIKEMKHNKSSSILKGLDDRTLISGDDADNDDESRGRSSIYGEFDESDDKDENDVDDDVSFPIDRIGSTQGTGIFSTVSELVMTVKELFRHQESNRKKIQAMQQKQQAQSNDLHRAVGKIQTLSRKVTDIGAVLEKMDFKVSGVRQEMATFRNRQQRSERASRKSRSDLSRLTKNVKEMAGKFAILDRERKSSDDAVRKSVYGMGEEFRKMKFDLEAVQETSRNTLETKPLMKEIDRLEMSVGNLEGYSTFTREEINELRSEIDDLGAALMMYVDPELYSEVWGSGQGEAVSSGKNFQNGSKSKFMKGVNQDGTNMLNKYSPATSLGKSSPKATGGKYSNHSKSRKTRHLFKPLTKKSGVGTDNKPTKSKKLNDVVKPPVTFEDTGKKGIYPEKQNVSADLIQQGTVPMTRNVNDLGMASQLVAQSSALPSNEHYVHYSNSGNMADGFSSQNNLQPSMDKHQARDVQSRMSSLHRQYGMLGKEHTLSSFVTPTSSFSHSLLNNAIFSSISNVDKHNSQHPASSSIVTLPPKDSYFKGNDIVASKTHSAFSVVEQASSLNANEIQDRKSKNKSPEVTHLASGKETGTASFKAPATTPLHKKDIATGSGAELGNHILEMEQRLSHIENIMGRDILSSGFEKTIDVFVTNHMSRLKQGIDLRVEELEDKTSSVVDELMNTTKKRRSENDSLQQKMKTYESEFVTLYREMETAKVMMSQLATQMSAIDMKEFLSTLQESLQNFTRKVMTHDKWKKIGDDINAVNTNNEVRILRLEKASSEASSMGSQLHDRLTNIHSTARRWFRSLQGHVIRLNNTLQDFGDRMDQMTQQLAQGGGQVTGTSHDLQAKMDSLHIQLLVNGNRLSGLEAKMLNRSLEFCRRSSTDLQHAAKIIDLERNQDTIRSELLLQQETTNRMDTGILKLMNNQRVMTGRMSDLSNEVTEFKPIRSQVKSLEKEVDKLLLQVPKDCHGYYERGYRDSGVYIILPQHMDRTVRVYCIMETHQEDKQLFLTDNTGSRIRLNDEAAQTSNSDEDDDAADSNDDVDDEFAFNGTDGDFEEVPNEDKAKIYNGGWTVIQRRFDGSTNFSRSWLEYASGFGRVRGEYWLGNDAIHHLTSQNDYEIRIVMEDIFSSVWEARYSHFRVEDRDSGYRLLISGYRGNASDGMSSSNQMAFSSIDRDEDSVSSHCALYGNAGWWYRLCHISNLNGQYKLGFLWFNQAWKDWITMKASVMMVKPKKKLEKRRRKKRRNGL